jgi:hypothetical protein
MQTASDAIERRDPVVAARDCFWLVELSQIPGPIANGEFSVPNANHNRIAGDGTRHRFIVIHVLEHRDGAWDITLSLELGPGKTKTTRGTGATFERAWYEDYRVDWP